MERGHIFTVDGQTGLDLGCFHTQAAFALVLNRRLVQNQLENFVKEQRNFIKQYEVTNEKEHIAQTADEKLQNKTDEFLQSHNRQNTDSNHLCQLPPAFQKCEIKTQKQPPQLV